MSAAPLSKRPKDTPLYQQRLPAWQPILTPLGVITAFLIVGIPFIIIGFVCKAASDKVVEVSAVYDGAGANAAYAACALGARFNGTKHCSVSLVAPADMEAPVFVYYALTNFYQNHRRYIASRNDVQLSGTVYTDPAASALLSCDPLRARGGKVLHPCGLMANSFFNDTFALSAAPAGATLDETKISWETDRLKKFKAVDQSVARDKVTYINDTYPGVVNNVDNEHFIVWMRPAALPSFRKLYGRIDTKVAKGDTLTFSVHANFPVEGFAGSKAIVVTTLSFLGGKNAFLGTAFLVVGFLCLALAILFATKQYVIGGRKLGDAAYLVNQAQRR